MTDPKPWNARRPISTIDSSALPDCTLEQLFRMGVTIHLDLEIEGVTHKLALCHPGGIEKSRDSGRHILTFREMKELMKLAVHYRVTIGDPIAFQKILDLIAFARSSALPLTLVEMAFEEEPCISSSTSSESATAAASS